MGTRRQIHIEQLDKKLSQIGIMKAPPQGWLRTIREALGMSRGQLAKQLNMTPQALAKAERNEAAGTISLNSLHKIAAAMGCEATHMVLPRTKLQSFMRAQAEKVARKIFERTELHMALENQRNDPRFVTRRIRELAEDLLRKSDRRLWEEL